MAEQNHTSAAEFILKGLSDQVEMKAALFVLLLLIHTITLLGNAGIIVAIRGHPQLHTSMYFFLGSLSIVDICFSSVVAPRTLVNFLLEKKTISFAGCMGQAFFYIVFVTSECFLLAVMAYDRYVAICNPLLYSSVMTRRLCVGLVVGCYIGGVLNSIIQMTFIIRLPFCSSNVINHFFCDVPPLLALSCSSTYINEMILFSLAGVIELSTISAILVSYIFIFFAILRIRSVEGRRKAFSTCVSHLIVVTMLYGTTIFMYLRPSSSYSLNTDKVVSVFYTVVIPMLNPLIYSLRNKEMKDALRRTAERITWFVKNKGKNAISRVCRVRFVLCARSNSWHKSQLPRILVAIKSQCHQGEQSPQGFPTHPKLYFFSSSSLKVVSYRSTDLSQKVSPLHIFIPDKATPDFVMKANENTSDLKTAPWWLMCHRLPRFTPGSVNTTKDNALEGWIDVAWEKTEQHYLSSWSLEKLISTAAGRSPIHNVKSYILDNMSMLVSVLKQRGDVIAEGKLSSSREQPAPKHLSFNPSDGLQKELWALHPPAPSSLTKQECIPLIAFISIQIHQLLEMTDGGNLTAPSSFILLGFSDAPELQTTIFTVFFSLYVLMVLGNLMMILLINTDPHLHIPMYFFLSHLSCMDFCLSSAITPKALETFLLGTSHISFWGCFAQMYIFIALAVSECFLLGVMAFDRYTAVCKPLLYTTTMTRARCYGMVVLVYTTGFLTSLVHITLAGRLSFCQARSINHFFCELPTLLQLSCSDTHRNKVVLESSAAFNIMVSVLMILVSYTCILHSVLQIPLGRRWLKVFSTCASHLAAVTVFYAPAFLTYVLPHEASSWDQAKLVSVCYSILTPTLNPLIYSLRNKEVKGALRRLWERKLVPHLPRF
ncbi:uncharacterized protein ACIB01_008510 [Guaruba guarouba]